MQANDSLDLVLRKNKVKSFHQLSNNKINKKDYELKFQQDF